ncbi:MAG TPA: two-component regulator propeller domain-containing protein [Chitinophagales bacterium]|nr:two-component regulator propeller domain-containing protein [Chitinophagales bacterium]
MITTENGLSNNSVGAIMQDKKGFMWFATAIGLDRFDGYTIKKFSYDPDQPYSVSWGAFNTLLEDKSGIIWMSSNTAGLYSFNPATEKYFEYRHENGNKNSLADDITFGMAIDSSGTIWIATHSGLDAFDPKSNSFSHFIRGNSDSSSISNNVVMGICLDDENNLLLITQSRGIDCFSTKERKVIRHLDFNSIDFTFDDWSNYICNISVGSNQNVWVSSDRNGFKGFNLQSKNTIQLPKEIAERFALGKTTVSAMLEDHSGNLWIGTTGKELIYLDHAFEKSFFKETLSVIQLPSNAEGIVEDREKNIWVATTDGGVAMVNTQSKKFISYQHDSTNVNSISSDNVHSFFRDREGDFFVCLNGVDLFDERSGKFSKLIIEEGGKNILEAERGADNSVWYVYQDRSGILWFPTEVNGLISYDPVTKKHHWYPYDPADSTSLAASSCTGIIEDRKGRYWVTTYGGGFEAFDPRTGKFRAFKVHEGPNSIGSNTVGGLMEDSKGNLYMGSLNGGLIAFNPDSETFRIYRHDPKNSFSIGSDVTFPCFESTKGIIWVAVIGGGINALNPATGKFRAFTEKDGLCSNAVSCLTEDRHGNIWAGTYNGISCFTPPANLFDHHSKFQFRNYNMNDGLPANEINFFGAYTDTDGTVYFGTSSGGMIRFHPDDLKDNPYLPPVYITDFKLFNQSVGVNDSTPLLTTSIEDTKEIKLSYQQNVFAFSFAALNYVLPEKNQYAYKLEGFDKDWIYTDATKRFVNYTNLDAGTYIFRVKGSNNDGVWNPKEATIKLIITPPYWETWWFRILVGATLAVALYAVYRYRLNQVLRMQRMRNKIASDLHDDLGSTLSSISVYSEIARKQAKENIPMLEKIGESSRKMIEGMSDIVWTISSENDSFENLIERMRSFAHELLSVRNIEYTFDVDESLSSMKLRMEMRRNVYLIFKEAIHNLAKYSEATKASIALSISDHTISLLIRDNGKGFDQSSVLSGDQPRKGNGLKNMKKRAADLKAELIIESECGKGTVVELKLNAMKNG